jgi:hypothetical protein
MPSSSEDTPGGGVILRHEYIDRPHVPAPGDGDLIDAVSEHIERYIGKIDLVYHEAISEMIHLDVHVVRPTDEHPYQTLITSGMSERPMNVPVGMEEWQYAELLICLPPDWPLDYEALKDDANYWPIFWLKTLARLPHNFNTWLAPSHTVPNGDPAEPFAGNTEFCCMLVDWPLLFDEGLVRLEISPAKTINFYSLVPLYREEMDHKLQHGLESLNEYLEATNVTELLDLHRQNTCTNCAT